MNNLLLISLDTLTKKQINEYVNNFLQQIENEYDLKDTPLILEQDNRISCMGFIEDDFVIKFNLKLHTNLIDLYWTLAHEIGHLYYSNKDARKDTEYWAEDFALNYLFNYFPEYKYYYKNVRKTELMSKEFKQKNPKHYKAYLKTYLKYLD